MKYTKLSSVLFMLSISLIQLPLHSGEPTQKKRLKKALMATALFLTGTVAKEVYTDSHSMQAFQSAGDSFLAGTTNCFIASSGAMIVGSGTYNLAYDYGFKNPDYFIPGALVGGGIGFGLGMIPNYNKTSLNNLKAWTAGCIIGGAIGKSIMS